MSVKMPSFALFIVAAAFGLAGQALLLTQTHCGQLEDALRRDFRVIFFIRPTPSRERVLILEEKFRAFPEVSDVRFVSPEEAFTELKTADPELVDSIATVGDNPLPAAFSVSLAVDALANLDIWLSEAQKQADWTDVRYKPAQLQAILRLRLYAHLLRLVLSTLACAVAGLALIALWRKSQEFTLARQRHAALSCLGAAFGSFVAIAIAWPLRRDEYLWALPSWSSQATLIVCCAALSWILWRDDLH